MSSAKSIHHEMADAWNKRDFSAIRGLCHREYSYTGPDGKEITGGPDAGAGVYEMYSKGFPDGRLEVRRVYADGNTAIAEMVGRGTHGGNFMGAPPSGKRAEVVICNVVELRDGKIYREREYMDMLTILSQIGAVSLPQQTRTA